MPYLRTVVSGNQVAQAFQMAASSTQESSTPPQPISQGVLEEEIRGLRSKARQAASGRLQDILSEYFDSTVTPLSQLNHTDMSTGIITEFSLSLAYEPSELSSPLYLGTIGELDRLGTTLTSSQRGALTQLHDTVVSNDSTATQMLSQLTNPALPVLPGSEDGGLAWIESLSTSGVFFEGTGVLSPSSFEPVTLSLRPTPTSSSQPFPTPKRNWAEPSRV